MSTPSPAVFLSYASEDAEAAQRIAEALRAADIEVWFDRSELRGGDAWDRSIREQIQACALFMPIISANAHARVEGYFRLEWKLAVDRSHRMAPDRAFLMPVVIDDTRQNDTRIPDRFRELQWTRLPAGETTQAIVERVKGLLFVERPQGPAAAQSAVSARSGVPPTIRDQGPASWRSKRALSVAVTVVILAVAAYIAVDRIRISKRAPPAVVAPPALAEKSIAVLPFVDLSEKRDQEYFADGMAEEVLNLLVKVPDLKVIGRTSSFQFKGKTEDLRKIGTSLGAAYVVEGSVRRSGDHLRVTAQLIDARDGTHRWSDTYDKEAKDTLKVQEEIAAGLVRALQLEVSDASFVQQRALPKSKEAYDTYLRGLHAINRYDQQGFDEAAADFKRSLQLDPSFVPAAEQLARTLCDQPSWGFVPPGVGFEQARAAANTVLKLDPNSALGHTFLGCVHIWYDWNWLAAQEDMRTAMTLAPYNALVLVFASEERMAVGQPAEAAHLLETALGTDPLLATLHEQFFLAYLRLGRFADAEHAARRALEISPTFEGAHHDLGVALLMQGKAQEALIEIQRETPAGGRSAGLVLAYQALHRDREALSELEHLEGEHGGDMAMYIAETYAFRGQKDEAFKWLNRAYAQKDIFLWVIKGDPLLKNLEADPRYKAFLRKMNLPE